MFKKIYRYILFAVIFLVLDSIYLKLITKHFNKLIFNIQLSNIYINKIAVVLCYIILTGGVYYFSIIKKLTYFETFLLGILIYGVYETTNMSILKKWTWETVIIDTIWGGIVCFLSVFCYYYIIKLLNM